MPIGIFKAALQSGQRQIAKVSSKDALEGVVCGALYLAAEGGVSREEADQINVSLTNCKPLEAFNSTDIGNAVSKFREMVEQGPRMAKIQFKKEIEEAVSKDASLGTVIVSIALDVADQGGLDEKEEARARELCQWCRVNASEFGL